jgi:hypothetical protein
MAGVHLFDRRALRAALLGGLVAGGLDITYAFVAYSFVGATPFDILHSVASGWLGRAAYEGGAATAALGLVSHLVIACVAAVVYVLVSRRVDASNRHPLVAGAVFGLGVFVVMNYVIVPLSAAAVGGPRGVFYPLAVLVHMFLVGVPIALFAQRASNRTLPY